MATPPRVGNSDPVAALDRSTPLRDTSLAAILAASALLAACAAPMTAPPGAVLEARLAQRCIASIGAEVATLHDFRRPDRAAAAGRLGIDHALQVVAVVAGSPADEAGLRPGDRLEAVDGEPVPPGAGARPAFLAALGRGGTDPVLRVRRDGEVGERVLRRRGGACTTLVALPPPRRAG